MQKQSGSLEFGHSIITTAEWIDGKTMNLAQSVITEYRSQRYYTLFKPKHAAPCLRFKIQIRGESRAARHQSQIHLRGDLFFSIAMIFISFSMISELNSNTILFLPVEATGEGDLCGRPWERTPRLLLRFHNGMYMFFIVLD
jgi:hypothetical protein